METNNKIANEIELEVLTYLNKCSRHLFITENKEFFKVFPFKVNDKWYYVAITFNGSDARIRVSDIGQLIQWYFGSTKQVIKRSLFPQHYNKVQSHPNFKQMKEKTLELVKYLQANYKGNVTNEITSDIKKMLSDVIYTEKKLADSQ